MKKEKKIKEIAHQVIGMIILIAIIRVALFLLASLAILIIYLINISFYIIKNTFLKKEINFFSKSSKFFKKFKEENKDWVYVLWIPGILLILFIYNNPLLLFLIFCWIILIILFPHLYSLIILIYKELSKSKNTKKATKKFKTKPKK